MKIRRHSLLAAALAATFLCAGTLSAAEKYKLTLKPNSTKYGSTSGGGTYKAGEEVKIKAIKKSGYAFAGWYKNKKCTKALNPEGYDNRKPTVRIEMPAKKTTYYAKFITKAKAKKSLKFKQSAKALATTPAEGRTGTKLSLPIGIASASWITVTATGLPDGLKISKTTGKIYGTPTEAGSFTVKVTVKDAAGNKITQNILLEIEQTVGARFDVRATSRGHRYEAETTTKAVALRMVRASSKKSVVGSDVVKVYNGDDLVKKYTVNWDEGVTTLDLSVKIPSGLEAGDKLKAVINGQTANRYINYIYFVDKENSAANPKWVGESFDFGEWTADIDAAKELAASTAVSGSTKAYTLVSIQGSMWCHDCANTDRNFLDLVDDEGNNRFKAWAKANNIALVSMDIPSFSGSEWDDFASPTLMSRVPYKSTLAFEFPAWGIYDVSLAGAPASLTNSILRSGLGYMSRKGITDDEAAETLEKFHDLAYNTPEEGGFHLNYGSNDVRNEDGNVNRTGVPIFVLLRSDGTIAARMTRFASKSPLKADRDNFDYFIYRFEEMLEIADQEEYEVDAYEVGNNIPSESSAELPVDAHTLVGGRLCHSDMRDTFKLTGVTGPATVSVELTGDSEAEVTAQFIKELDGEFELVGDAVTVSINSYAELTCDIEESGTYYLRIAGADITSEHFAVENASADNFTSFTLKASLVEN